LLDNVPLLICQSHSQIWIILDDAVLSFRSGF
jgi:hypothetical protein